MKLSVKLAGVTGSIVYLGTSLVMLFSSMDMSTPTGMTESMQAMSMQMFKILMVAFPGAIFIGTLAFLIGDILSKPRGDSPRGPGKNRKIPHRRGHQGGVITGNETFMDDLANQPLPMGQSISGVEAGSAIIE